MTNPKNGNKYFISIVLPILSSICLIQRKSKWDQPAPSAVAIQQQSIAIKSTGLITTSISGTKGTVISAFGSLPKKPKA